MPDEYTDRNLIKRFGKQEQILLKCICCFRKTAEFLFIDAAYSGPFLYFMKNGTS